MPATPSGGQARCSPCMGGSRRAQGDVALPTGPPAHGAPAKQLCPGPPARAGAPGSASSVPRPACGSWPGEGRRHLSHAHPEPWGLAWASREQSGACPPPRGGPQKAPLPHRGPGGPLNPPSCRPRYPRTNAGAEAPESRLRPQHAPCALRPGLVSWERQRWGQDVVETWALSGGTQRTPPCPASPGKALVTCTPCPEPRSPQGGSRQGVGV